MAAGYVLRRIGVPMLAGLAIVGAATTTATAATAPAPSVSLVVSPSSVPAGGVVRVSGTCEANTEGVAFSTAFLHDAAHDFAGVGAAAIATDAAGAFSADAQIPASTAPGTYTVSVRCGGGIIGVSAALTVTAPGAPPTAVPAGSGGRAAATGSGRRDADLLLGGVGLLLVAGGALGVTRLRRPFRR